MKRNWILAVILGAGLLVSLPSPGYSGNGRYYGGHGNGNYYGGHGNGHSNGNYWGTAAVIAGGLVLGTAIAATVFAPPRYVVREPVYAYPTNGGYAYADPGYASQPPPGVWRTVPGQWINGRWVPAHQVWVPVNPY